MRLWYILALATAARAYAQSDAPGCVSVGRWSFVGPGKGTVTARPGGKAMLEFTPTKDEEAATFVLTIGDAKEAVYQLNADFDVARLEQDALFTLAGAKSALPGREFDVRLAKGDDGSSSFSRPLTTFGKPFTIVLHTRGAVAMTARNIKLCFLHYR